MKHVHEAISEKFVGEPDEPLNPWNTYLQQTCECTAVRHRQLHVTEMEWSVWHLHPKPNTVKP